MSRLRSGAGRQLSASNSRDAPAAPADTEYHYIETENGASSDDDYYYEAVPPHRTYENLRVLSELDRVQPHKPPPGPHPSSASGNRKSFVDTYVLLAPTTIASHSQHREPSDDNIYENICEICCAIFSGSQCAQCEALERPPSVPPPPQPRALPAAAEAEMVASAAASNANPPSPPRLASRVAQYLTRVGGGRLIGSLRKPAGKARRVRPTIVHNVDAVFRTNQSFDLGEISRLKWRLSGGAGGEGPGSHYARLRCSRTRSVERHCRNPFLAASAANNQASSVDSLLSLASSTEEASASLTASLSASSTASASSSTGSSQSTTSSSASSATASLLRPHDVSRRSPLRDWMTSLRRATDDDDDDAEDAHWSGCEQTALIVPYSDAPPLSCCACCTLIGRIQQSNSVGHRCCSTPNRLAARSAAVVPRWRRPLSCDPDVFRQQQVVPRRARNATTPLAPSDNCAKDLDNIERPTATKETQNDVKLYAPSLVLIRKTPTRRDRLTHFFVCLALGARLSSATCDQISLQLFGRQFPVPAGVSLARVYNRFVRFAIDEMTAQQEALQFEEDDAAKAVAKVAPEERSVDVPIDSQPPAILQRNPHIGRTPPIPAPRNLKPQPQSPPASASDQSPLQRQSPVRRKRFGLQALNAAQLPAASEASSHRHGQLIAATLTEDVLQQRRRGVCCECPREMAMSPGDEAEEAIYQSIWSFQTVGNGADRLIDELDDDGSAEKRPLDGDEDDDDDGDDDDEAACGTCGTCGTTRQDALTAAGSRSNSSGASSPSLLGGGGGGDHRWEVSDDFTFSSSAASAQRPLETSTTSLSDLSAHNEPNARRHRLNSAERRRTRDASVAATVAHLAELRAVHPFREVLVLLSADRYADENQLLYDLEQPLFEASSEGDEVFGDSRVTKEPRVTALPDANNNSSTTQTLPASVGDWKRMLRTVDYAEDEEDVNLPANFKPNLPAIILHDADHHGLDNAEPTVMEPARQLPTPPRSPFKATPPIGIPAVVQPSGKLSGSDGTPSKTRQLLNSIKNKLQPDRSMDYTIAYDTSGEAVELGSFKSINNLDKISARAPSPSRPSGVVFGAELREIELITTTVAANRIAGLRVPRFVDECVRFMEKTENLQTGGIYRASGKKESIDRLKKKMNKTASGSKYEMIQSEDVHTISGGLKQFFRELPTALISSELVERLPDNLMPAESTALIRIEIQKMDRLPLDTLRFIVRHLQRVDQHNEHNLMTAYNLSIVWGACIFPSLMATSMENLDTRDLLRKNQLVMVLIERYAEVFEGEALVAKAGSSEC